MKRRFAFTTAAALTAMLACSGVGYAAQGGIPGPPDDGGGAPPVDFGDLIKLYRNPNGVPYLTSDLCVQPLPSDSCDTSVCKLVDGVADGMPTAVQVIPVDPATCAVIATCATCTEEVDFGRINEARSSDEVFDSQLQDVIVNLASSDCEVTLDPAGRMVTGTIPDPTVPDVYTTSAIDSPLQSLAVYRQLIQTGSIGVPLPQGADVLTTAARGLGAASDKTGEVNVDLVAYLNQIMGLTDHATTTILDPKICINVREEVQGAVQLVQKCFLDYGTYVYNRGDNFTLLPSPAYIPAGGPADGYFEYLAVLDPVWPTFEILQGPIVDAVFPDSPFVDFDGGNIGAFAQTADDTRAVIDFMHNWPVPNADIYATPAPCAALAVTTYEVSIPEQSGLQVPRNVVSGTEGREFTVTVANAGPDPATGTVTVSAVVADGSVITGEPWVFVFTDLGAGESTSFIQLFTVTVSEATTIAWRATLEAPFDISTTNNTRTATSNVRVTAGGGGGE